MNAFILKNHFGLKNVFQYIFPDLYCTSANVSKNKACFTKKEPKVYSNLKIQKKTAYVTLITRNSFILFAPHQSLKVPVAEILMKKIFLMKNYCFQKFAALLPFFPHMTAKS